ncbi:MAG: aminopeptidase P family protein [Lachnospiraceae bacterium]|nr:aminopeptidase P family protein [Lachnospiraceae bacterium]
MNNASINERVSALRQRMAEVGVDAYFVATDDFHGSEYVGDFFKCREFITGFTGSAGEALILKDAAYLWTDGRYFIQAERELKGSPFVLMRSGTPGVLSVTEMVAGVLQQGQTLAFDGRTVTESRSRLFKKALEKSGVCLRTDVDLVGEVWPDRPAMSCEKLWFLEEEWCGQSRAEKLERVRRCMKEKGAQALVMASLDDIAWTLNIRGNDIACNPVVLSYLILEEEKATLFVQEDAVAGNAADMLNGNAGSRMKELEIESGSDRGCIPARNETEQGEQRNAETARERLGRDGVEIRPYGEIGAALRQLKAGRVWLDPGSVSSFLFSQLPESAERLEEENPTRLMKAVKNETEVEHMRQAHIRDGVAVTKFIYWLKTHVGKEEITEISAAEKLEEFRSQGENYLGPSFDTIAGYAEHGAIVHYSATPETDAALKAEHMLLVDSGGQYLEGTTDITRTIVLGPINRKEKEYFTRVLRGTLKLAAAVFAEGCSGVNFDYLARGPLWEIGEDFRHGTGHGIGYCLNVHEGPNSFHFRAGVRKDCLTVFQPGMITSDEPGYYCEGEFGIRHENLIVCVKDQKTEYGQFLRFEHLTMVPFDLEGIDPALMSERERQLLNDYHAQVYEKIGPYLEEEERAWLREATAGI